MSEHALVALVSILAVVAIVTGRWPGISIGRGRVTIGLGTKTLTKRKRLQGKSGSVGTSGSRQRS